MRVVIDIPVYLIIMCEQFSNSLVKYEVDELVYAINNGKKLSKGHGKLVDIEDVKDNIRKWKGYLDEDMITRINFTMDNNIPTIIERDGD